ncbi:flagella basal body P-ring formation protein FlgA [Sphingomonas carotinifaciens]|uniref:flagella basal body P-ring formation protein FlgA n=1 Tax=Sphingomonas TaxID=13687 RepID=UPI000DD88521|nr:MULTISPECIES: flagella basal body P-ring formation protein FlgA [Sphingomonas]
MILLSLLAAVAFQDTAGLDRAVAAFTGHAVGEVGGARTAVDPRLRLAQCPTVAISWRTPAQDAVVIACAGPDWRIFVPVNRPAAAVAAPAALRPAMAPATTREPPVIRRGDPVMIEAGSNGFSISREGVAMGDAAPGARFMVRIDTAKQPVQVVALAAGHATLAGYE